MRSKLLLAVAFSTVALAACGSSKGSSSSTTAAAPATTAAATATTAGSTATTAGSTATTSASSGSATTAAASGAATVKVADSKLGKILVTADGRTIYAFTKDTAGTPTCTGACAENWPAVLVTGTPSGDGIDASLVSTVPSASGGGQQLKIEDYPVYTFVGDAAPGDVNGQGVSGVWFVVGTNGEPIKG